VKKSKEREGRAVAATLQLLKDTNPLIPELIDELKQVKLGLYVLHDLKLQHRRKTPFGSFHCCRQCEMWSRAQEHLREKRTAIGKELERESYGLDPMSLLLEGEGEE
jgi:hypothetical protein